MNIKYLVELSADERKHLLEITSKGKQPARVLKRANILLMADLNWLFDVDKARQKLSRAYQGLRQ